MTPKRNKAANGTGTTYKHGPSWCAELTYGYDDAGKAKRWRGSFPTQQAAEDALALAARRWGAE